MQVDDDGIWPYGLPLLPVMLLPKRVSTDKPLVLSYSYNGPLAFCILFKNPMNVTITKTPFDWPSLQFATRSDVKRWKWVRHKLANNLICIGNIQSSRGKINKKANQCPVENRIRNRFLIVLVVFDIQLNWSIKSLCVCHLSHIDEILCIFMLKQKRYQ